MFEHRVQRSMEAMNHKDLAAVMQPWADDAVFEFLGHTRISGRYEGKAAIEGFFKRVFEELQTIRISVKHAAFSNPVGLTYSNTVYIEYDVEETTTAGVTINDERISVPEYRRGKVVSMREWAFDPTILEALWIAEPGTA